MDTLFCNWGFIYLMSYLQVVSKQNTKSNREKKESESADGGEKVEKREKSSSKLAEAKENGKSRASRKEAVEIREASPTYVNIYFILTDMWICWLLYNFCKLFSYKMVLFPYRMNNKEKFEKEEIKEDKPRTKERKEEKHMKEERLYRVSHFLILFISLFRRFLFLKVFDLSRMRDIWMLLI